MILVIRRTTRFVVNYISPQHDLLSKYSRYDTLIDISFFLIVFVLFEIHFNMTTVVILFISFLLLHFVYVLLLIDRAGRREVYSSFVWLQALFVISGFSALIYQIAWQRTLFLVFGINIESVTIIVSVFMLGLGIGSLFGGALTKRYETVLPKLFLICEVVIGGYGIISIPLMKAIGSVMSGASLITVTLLTYGVLFIPTVLMGATLPILVSYLHRHYRNIGKSVGLFYALNTVGSAFACFFTVDVLFMYGIRGSVMFAALCNFFVGFCVYNYIRFTEGNKKSMLSSSPI
ncbi:MAG: hypothetical protein HQL06_16500 [Nitrospirae bacterium]|nr:hypothetical protein [Nitrospirota bacterium]